MRTKFIINDEIFAERNLTEGYEYYEEWYKKHGFIFDKENEEVYMILEKEININEGERVCLYGIRLVRWKCVDVINDIIEYSLEEE